MDIYKLGSGQILAVVTDETGTKARRFVVADIPGYPDDIPTAAAYVEAQTIAGPEDLALILPSQMTNPLLVLPAVGSLDDSDIEAEVRFRNLPNWATWTGAEAAEALRTGILNGMTKTEARAAIDAQFAGVTNLAQLGAATVAVLKTLADAVIEGLNGAVESKRPGPPPGLVG